MGRGRLVWGLVGMIGAVLTFAWVNWVVANIVLSITGNGITYLIVGFIFIAISGFGTLKVLWVLAQRMKYDS